MSGLLQYSALSPVVLGGWANMTSLIELTSSPLWRRGKKIKESLQLRLWNFNICIEKVEAKFCPCKMLIGGDDISNDVITLGTCFSMFPRRADWRKFDSSVDGEPKGNWRWYSNSTDVVASFPSFFRPAVRALQRA